MNKYLQYFLTLMLPVALLFVIIVRQHQHVALEVTGVQTEVLLIDSTTDALADSTYLEHLAPLRADMEAQLGEVIGTAPRDMRRYRPESELLNWSCDALASVAREVSGKDIDFAVVNVGGLRCDWSAGELTLRSVYELMPFDNELVILTLSGAAVLELAENCVLQGGQGVSQELRVVGREGQVEQVLLHGQPIRTEGLYTVATSDYLAGGADGLSGLTRFTEKQLTGKKIRDLYIGYIRTVGTVEAALDGRMTIE